MSVNKNDTKFFFFFSTPKIVKLRLIVITVGIIVFLSIMVSNPKLNTNAQLQQQQQDQPNINAANVYQTQTMVLGNNIKDLVILIPNEAHEPPNLEPKELRVVNQPYLPENAVVNVGTTITWFNADVKHPHKITLVDNKSKNIVFESDTFEYFTASKPIKFNNTGTFTYSGPSFDKAFPKYIMNGTLTVVNQPVASTTSFNNTTISATSSPTAATNDNIDTITTLMVPENLLDKVTSELKDQGFGIDNQYAFKSLRGGGSAAGGDKQQVLLVLTSSGKNLDEVVSALSKITPTMPYS